MCAAVSRASVVESTKHFGLQTIPSQTLDAQYEAAGFSSCFIPVVPCIAGLSFFRKRCVDYLVLNVGIIQLGYLALLL